MAKKKSSGVAAPAVAPAPPGENLPDQLESLKSLNQLLLKETVERREQVSELESSLRRLSLDHSLSSDIERSVASLIVASHLADLAAEMEAAAARTRAAEARLEVVAREKVSVALERDSAREDLSVLKRQADARAAAFREEAEKQKSDLVQMKDRARSLEEENAAMEAALRSSSDRLELIKGERGQAVKDLERTVLERDRCRKDLDALSRELRSAREKLQSSYSANSALKEEIVRMQLDFEECRTKTSIEVDSLKEELQSIEQKKERLMQEKVALESEIASLQIRVSAFDSILQEKVTLEEKLSLAEETVKVNIEHLDATAAEKDVIRRALDQAISERDLILFKLAEEEKWKAFVTKETESLRVEFSSLEKEKEQLQLQIKVQKEDYAKELDVLRDTVQKIEEEKDEINRMRGKQGDEIMSLKHEVAKLLDTVSQLQEMCRANSENNAQLQADKESSVRDLHLKMKEVDALRLQVDELKKKKDEVQNELHQTKASLVSLVAEHENTKGDFSSLTTEKAALEETLQNALRVAKESEGKTRTAEENFGRVLSLLKATSDVINDSGEGKTNDTPREFGSKREPDAGLRHVEEEFDAIMVAFKSKVAKTKDMNQELEALRSAIAESKKRVGLLTWICPAAATLLTAVSIAYAKCR